MTAAAATALPVLDRNTAMAAASPARPEETRKKDSLAARPSACLHAIASTMHAKDPAKGRKPASPDEAGINGSAGLAMNHFALSASYAIAMPVLSARMPLNTTAASIIQSSGSWKTSYETRARAS